jgi:hypothetical protein
MDAVVSHTLLNGTELKMCLRCMLKVDENGKPDPNWYTEEWIKKFNESAEEKCNHNRRKQ